MRAIDTETEHAGTVSQPIPPLVCVAYYDPAGGPVLEASHRVDWGHVVETYQRGAILANSPFDAFVLREAGPDWVWRAILDAYDAGKVHDVNTREKMVAAATGRQIHRVNLGSVCTQYGIHVDKDDPVRTRYREVQGMEIDQYPEEFRHYALRDPQVTYEAWVAQEKSAPAGTFATLADQARGHLALWHQTVTGIRNDVERATTLSNSIAERMCDIELVLMRHGLIRIEGGTKRSKRPPVAKSNQKVAQEMIEKWCAETGNKVTKTKKGPSLATDALRVAKLPPEHPVRGYALRKSLGSMRNKNCPVFMRPYTRTRYDEFKVTGRTGSSNPSGSTRADNCSPDQWTGTNIQNLARPDTLAKLGFDEGEGFRECLIPREGYVFGISDWGGAELVTLAQTCLHLFGWSRLAEILNEGRDLHGEMASKILGIEAQYPTKDERDAMKLVGAGKLRAEDAPARVAAHFEALKTGSWVLFDKGRVSAHKEARQLAKAADFGFPGGLGAGNFVLFARNNYGIEITEYEAKRLKRLWKQLLPEMDFYFEWINSLCVGGRNFRVTIPGLQMTRICGFNDACNFSFQGLAAVAAKRALWWLYRAGMEPTSPLFGTRQLLFVHDENVSEIPNKGPEFVRAAVVEKERLMIGAFGTTCPDVLIGVESDVSTCYDK